jgi:hypothetical protein
VVVSRRTDRKLREIPLARYAYRHEAEFAAGFLDEAGVPYRLQVDDPAMGITLGMSATLWVRGIDEPRAREVLELDDDPRLPTAERRSVRFDGARAAGSVPGRLHSGRVAEAERERGGPVRPTLLSGRERGLVLLASGALLGGGLVLPDTLHPIVQAAPPAGALLLALTGILGRAPDGLRRFLRAVAGDAP